MSMPGMTEWLFIFLIVMVLFGARRLPDLGNSIGRGLRNFKEALSGRESTEVRKDATKEA